MGMGVAYSIIEASESSAWRVGVSGYWYVLSELEGGEILAFHWHPEGRSSATNPHLHLGAAARVDHPALAAAHIPTGRVAPQDFLRMLIEDFSVKPRRPDWDAVLRQSLRAFQVAES